MHIQTERPQWYTISFFIAPGHSEKTQSWEEKLSIGKLDKSVAKEIIVLEKVLYGREKNIKL